ncbi:MAG: PH domain-containing protein, partial [Nanoarchaeota archaeon]|nr:PH domain-containing protein [Nanoarchaeota archaeon]
KELDKVLDKNETVLWEGKPNFWPFLLGGSLLTTLFGLFWMLFLIPFLVIAAINITRGGLLGWGIFLLPHFWVGIVLVFGIPLYQILVYKHVYYAITNKRVLLQKGLIGRDFEMVDFDQITNAEVNVGLFDNLFGGNSGSILISTAGSFTSGRYGPVQRPYTLRNIDKPYDVFKLFKQVSHAVKTDIQYPNKYRPKTNPGYKTAFNPKK